jgi:hypothetical protein
MARGAERGAWPTVLLQQGAPFPSSVYSSTVCQGIGPAPLKRSPRVRVQDSETTTWEKPEELGWRRVIKDEL